MADEFEQYLAKDDDDEFDKYAVKEKPKEEEEEYQTPRWQDIFAKALQNPEARIGMQPGVAEARETPMGQALELPLYLAAPEIGLPRLGAAAAKYLPRAGKYLTSAIQNALPQAGIAGGMSALSGENPLGPAAATGAITGPTAALSEFIASGNPYARFAGKLGAMGAGGYLGYQGSKAVGANPFETILSTAGAAALPAFFGKLGGNGVDKGIINKWMGNVFDKSEKKLKSDLYKEGYKDLLAPADMAKLSNNKVYKSALKRVKNDAAYAEDLKNVPENSVQYQHQVTRKMSAMENKAIREGDNTRAAIIEKSKNKLKEKLYDSSTSFEKAQGIAERQITKRDVNKFFNDKELTGQNFAKILNNKEKYAKLQTNLRNVPDAQKQLTVMKEVFEKIKDIKPDQNFGKINIFKDILNSHKYDKAMQELATNPVWKGELNQLLKDSVSKKEKFIGNFVDIVGKAGAQVVR